MDRISFSAGDSILLALDIHGIIAQTGINIQFSAPAEIRHGNGIVIRTGIYIRITVTLPQRDRVIAAAGPDICASPAGHGSLYFIAVIAGIHRQAAAVHYFSVHVVGAVAGRDLRHSIGPCDMDVHIVVRQSTVIGQLRIIHGHSARQTHTLDGDRDAANRHVPCVQDAPVRLHAVFSGVLRRQFQFESFFCGLSGQDLFGNIDIACIDRISLQHDRDLTVQRAAHRIQSTLDHFLQQRLV